MNDLWLSSINKENTQKQMDGDQSRVVIKQVVPTLSSCLLIITRLPSDLVRVEVNKIIAHAIVSILLHIL